MPSLEVIIFALLGGLAPTLVWLWFWLREDRCHPEPTVLLLSSFLAGMVAVPLVIPLERAIEAVTTGTLMVVLWAMIEESMKFGAAYLIVLRRKEMNEPVDAVIYMITVALGFAALENALFLLSPVGNGLLAETLLTGNLRFLGATLLHTLASATIGVAIAVAFYRGARWRDAAAALGLILATALHALFNFSILSGSEKSEGVLVAFLSIWIGAVVLILLFEKVKRIPRPLPTITRLQT